MKIFGLFIKSRLKDIVVFFVFTCIFAVVFYGYGIEIKAVIYSSELCAFIGIIVMIIDFVNYYKKHNQLTAIKNEITIYDKHLPETMDVIEKDYQNLIITLIKHNKNLENGLNQRYTDLIEYYTVWAHQIKTPIASMYLSLNNIDENNRRIFTEDLKRTEQYVEMVLCYLRLNSDSTDYIIKEYDIDDIVKAAVRKFSTQFIIKKIRLIYKPLNIKVLTDKKWLLFVVEQIISNALKYTKSGQVEIYLENNTILCIRDSGIGIEKEDVPRIFDKGYTGYNGRSDTKATGIGLYLCKTICKKLNHKIWAESEIGKGTVIKIDVSYKHLIFDKIT